MGSNHIGRQGLEHVRLYKMIAVTVIIVKTSGFDF